MNLFNDVKKFHEKFDLLPKSGKPELLSNELEEYRIKFMTEELDEFSSACDAGDLVKAVDALCDLVYVALGTAVMMGVPFNDCWQQVQSANMRKVRVTSIDQSKRKSAYDVVKPPGWTPPEEVIEAVLISYGAEL